MRLISASRETELVLKSTKRKKLVVDSFFYIDPPNDISEKHIVDWKDKMFQMTEAQKEKNLTEIDHIDSPLVNDEMNKYGIFCKKCKELQGFVHAKNKFLDNWCNFHYRQWTDGENWYGCFSPHVSPITGKLCLECTCGQDTRDFSINKTLPGAIAYMKEQNNKIGREYGKNNSKFLVKKVKNA